MQDFGTHESFDLGDNCLNLDYNHLSYLGRKQNTRPKLLLIDDDSIYTSIFYESAFSLDFQTKILNDYRDLPKVKGEEFDVAIVDYDLGETTGQELSKNIRAMFGSIPIIIISASNRPIAESSMGGDYYDFIHKSLGSRIILDAAYDASEWWKLNCSK